MSDILTMRAARAATRRADAAIGDFHADFEPVLELLTLLSQSDSPRATARAFLDAAGYPLARADTEEFQAEDLFLASAGNRPRLSALIAQLNGGSGAGDMETLEDWLNANLDRVGALSAVALAALLTVASPSLRTSLSRALSIYSLIDHIAANLGAYQTLAGNQDPSPDLIFDTLRWRKLVFPKALASIAARLNPPANAVVREGLADLYVLSSEWRKYESGEIAYIENVLPGEKRKRQLTRVDVQEATQSVETDSTTTTEQDNQVTDRFELNDESTRDVQLAVHAEAQVDTSGQYGPTKVDSHLGGSLDYSQHDTTRRAVTQSRETVARAVTRVEQAVRTIRTQRSLTRTKELNLHELQNKATQPFTGIYRWVDKIVRFTLTRYPNRYLLEFQIPEPAMWLRWLYNLRDAPTGVAAQNPLPFTKDGTATAEKLVADDVGAHPTRPDGSTDPNYYAALGARYYASSLKPAPTPVLVNELFIRPTEDPWNDKGPTFDPIKFVKLGDITIPAGYVAKRWWITLSGWGEPKLAGRKKGDIFYARVFLGQAFENNNAPGVNYEPDWDGPVDAAIDALANGPFDVTAQGMGEGIGKVDAEVKLPVSIDLHSVRGVAAKVIVECVPSQSALQSWRIETYEKLASAYFAMKDRYDSEVAASAIRRGLVIQGNSPERNKEVVREELKKHIVGLLFDRTLPLPSQPFSWQRAVKVDEKSAEPSVDTLLATERAPTVLFIEQAFEWEKLSYVPYPYLWADRASQWTELADLQSADPEFAQFLRAGSARTVLSVRPGFESAVQTFLKFGIVWNGGNAPAPGELDYLSMADELRALERAPDDGVPVEHWEARLPTSLVWLQGGLPLPDKSDGTGGSSPPPKPPSSRGWLCRLLDALCRRDG